MKKLTQNQFINKSNIIHNNKYDYSMSDFKNTKIKVQIICPIHGVFPQTPKAHLNGQGCIKCNKRIPTNDEFINKINEIHGNKYDTSRVNYKNIRTKVKLICSEHGEFEIRPDHLILNKTGCYKCENKKIFMKKAKEIHNDKYDYSLVKYSNAHDIISIICKKHGIFKQLAYQHINGSGCPKCNESKGEKKIRKYLIDNKIEFENQKKFYDCKYISSLRFDFYLPKLNICIEYDGEQHFILKKYWGGEKEFKKIQKRDKIKNQYCKKNHINLLRIKYDENILEKLNSVI
jgi:very-short-patch-repair endonuclease